MFKFITRKNRKATRPVRESIQELYDRTHVNSRAYCAQRIIASNRPRY